MKENDEEAEEEKEKKYYNNKITFKIQVLYYNYLMESDFKKKKFLSLKVKFLIK